MKASEFVTESPTADLKNLARAAAKKYSAGQGTANNPHPADSYHGKIWQQTFDKAKAKLPEPELDLITDAEALPSVKTPTPQQLSAKHRVPLEVINKQVDKGTRAEMEHTTDVNTAREIALDHLLELPDYYDRLEKMEKE